MDLVPITNPPEEYPFWMLAKYMASRSTQKMKLGAVLVKKNDILGYGYNSSKTHPLGSKDYKTLHAEIAALYHCLKRRVDVEGAVMYVFRKNSLLAKPCKWCEKTLRKHGISKVYYTDKIPSKHRRKEIEKADR